MVFNKKVILVRHGNQKDNDSSNPGLSKYGFEQAEMLAVIIKRLAKDCKNIALLSSSKLRAVETAEIISEALGKITITTEENLVESKVNLDIAWTIDRVLSTEADLIIIVAHYHLVKELPETLGFHEYFPGYCEGIFFEDRMTEISIQKK